MYPEVLELYHNRLTALPSRQEKKAAGDAKTHEGSKLYVLNEIEVSM